MEKEIYTPMERLLIETMVRRQEREDALEATKKLAAMEELDQMLLELEEQQDMLDGLKMEVYLL